MSSFFSCFSPLFVAFFLNQWYTILYLFPKRHKLEVFPGEHDFKCIAGRSRHRRHSAGCAVFYGTEAGEAPGRAAESIGGCRPDRNHAGH